VKARFVSSLTSARVGWNGTCAPFSTVTTALGFGGWEGRGGEGKGAGGSGSFSFRFRVSSTSTAASRSSRSWTSQRPVRTSHLPPMYAPTPAMSRTFARARSRHLLLGLKNARREEHGAEAEAGKPTRDSHGRGSRATQSEPREDEVRTHRRDPATTRAGLRTLIWTASSSPDDSDAAGCRFGVRSVLEEIGQPRLHPRHSSHRAASLDLLIIPRHRQEKLFNNLRRGDRGTPQRLAPRHCDARAEPPERSGASQPCRSASRYPRSSLRERLDTCCRRVVEGIVSSRRGERTRRDSRRAA